MKIRRWYVSLGIALVVISVSTYLLQILLFKKIEDTLFYMVQDLAFVPFQVLLVMLIIDRLLRKKEKETLLNKLNMVVGAFYHEMGRDLISILIKCNAATGELTRNLDLSPQWDDKRFNTALKIFKAMKPSFHLDHEALHALKDFLMKNQREMLHMLENPNLLEHDSFTDMLWAVFHLSDELANRQDLENLPKNDIDHLKIDTARAFSLVVVEWIAYMKHLRKSYPFLYSIAVRRNPFDPGASVVIA